METITLSTKNFEKIIQTAVRDEIYNITHNLSSDEFEEFLRAKRYDNMIENIENGTTKLKTQSSSEFLEELKQL